MRFALHQDASASADPWRLGCGRLEATAGGVQAVEQTWLYASRFDPGLETAHVGLDLTGSPRGPLTINLSEYKFVVGTVRAPGSRLSIGSAVLHATGRRVVTPGERVELLVTRGAGRLTLHLDGEALLEADDPFPELPLLDVSVDLPAGVIVHGLVVDGEPGASGDPVDRVPESVATPRRPSSVSGYELAVCIDLIDDIIENTWSERTFREAMDFYRGHGMRRVYFIYHYGYHGGFWGAPGYDLQFPGLHERMRRTYDNVGEFLPAAVRSAREAGLELHAVVKPFEGGLPFTYPEGTDLARQFGRVPRLGGMMWWCADFLKEHPELRIGRRPADAVETGPNRGIHRILLRAEPGTPGRLDPNRLRLWVSADNATYRPYDRPPRVTSGEAPAPVLEITDLDVAEPYLAITVEGEPTHRFGNLARHLVTVYDRSGRELQVTLSRAVSAPGLDFRANGLTWDVVGREDDGEFNYADSYDCLDAGRPLGITVGTEPYLAGAMSPFYSEVRTWWLELVDQCLAADVDGIDFRIANHNFALDWSVYGFEQPVVRAFEARHGVNILKESFDREAWRRLRGEPYTDFLRQASARLRQAGRKVSAHVNTYMVPPRVETTMNLHWDWPNWIREGLLDEITVKRWRMDALTNGIAPRIVAEARRASLPVNYCPYLNALPPGNSGRQVLDFHRREALEGGAARFIMYENAAFMRARDDGAIEITQPRMVEMVAGRQPVGG